MHLKSDDIKIIIYDKADEVIMQPFEFFPNIYQIWLDTSMRGMRGSDFIFDCIKFLAL